MNEALQLAKEILEFAEHADYSNGNTDEYCTTLDEGNVRAGECLEAFRKRIEDLTPRIVAKQEGHNYVHLRKGEYPHEMVYDKFCKKCLEMNNDPCEGCELYTIPTAHIVIDGKQIKTCNSGNHPDSCKRAKKNDKRTSSTNHLSTPATK